MLTQTTYIYKSTRILISAQPSHTHTHTHRERKMETLTAATAAATAAAIALLSLFSVTEGKFRILASLLLGVVLRGRGGVYPSRRVAMF